MDSPILCDLDFLIISIGFSNNKVGFIISTAGTIFGKDYSGQHGSQMSQSL